MFSKLKTSPQLRSPRAGSALVLTLIVIALLTLGAMAYSQRMIVEFKGTRASGRQLQARQLAESGVDFLKYMLSQDRQTQYQMGGVYANPNLLMGVLVTPDDSVAAFRGRFTCITPDMTTDGLYNGIRYGGIENESSRLNLNAVLLADELVTDGGRLLLMSLPGMTEPIADAILDWVDEDTEPRAFGAEANEYSMAQARYTPRNAPLHSLEELLLVRDVTPALLFGADLNRDGIIQVVEEPLMAIDGVDNNDGSMSRGWSAYLTLDSAERNARPDGTPKIDVNMEDLTLLQQELSEFLSTDQVNFIIAYRQGGVTATSDDDEEEAGGGTGGGGTGGGGTGGGGTGGTATQTVEAGSLQIDIAQAGRVSLTSILDLIGSTASVVQLNQTQAVNVNSPFTEDGAMSTYLPLLMENLAVNASPTIPGRININQAPRWLLMGIPGMDPVLAEQIIVSRDVLLGAQQADQAYETWLLTQGLVDLAKMKELLPLITSGGDIYRARVVGYFDGGGPLARLEVVIDATKRPPVVLRRWELESLGQDLGYLPADLGAVLDNN